MSREPVRETPGKTESGLSSDLSEESERNQAFQIGFSPNAAEWPEPDSGRYLILGEFARGGRGRILEAYDRRLDRIVALKQLLTTDSQAHARFAREALVTARLQHPAIIPIFDVGRWPSGEPFYSMKMITSGRSMAEVLHEKRTLAERLTLLPALVTVSDAIAYAHQQGVLHRDLKPSNILLGPFGETVVIDWGLAADLRATEFPQQRVEGPYQLATLPLTLTGSVMGTPLYMAPEQSIGERLDERADVYALGSILYHLLAGAPPYADASPHRIREMLAREPPVPVEERERQVPRELAAIARKALAKSPADRYPTAQVLSEELKRFQTGQLVRAYNYSTLSLVRRWVRRHRAPVLVAVFFVALFIAASALAVRRIVREKNLAEARQNELILFQARNWLEKDPTAVIAWLKSYPPLPENMRVVRDTALKAYAEGVARHVVRRDEFRGYSADFSKDGRLFAAAGRGRVLQIRETESGNPVAQLPYGGATQGVSFFPDGRRVLFSDWNDNLLRVWDFRAGQEYQVRVPAAIVRDKQLSSDGRWVAVATGQPSIWLWNVENGQSRELEGHRAKVNKILFSETGQLMSSSDDSTVRSWGLATGESRVFEAVSSRLDALATSADGARVASVDGEGSLHVWDGVNGKRLFTLSLGDQLMQLAFSPDGRWLAVAGASGALKLINMSHWNTVSLVGHQGSILATAFSPNGKLLASGGRDTTVRLWDMETGTEQQVLRGHSAPLAGVLFSSDGRFLASCGDDGQTRIWRISLAVGEKVFQGHTDNIQRVTFSPDGQTLATASRDTTVRLWNIRSGESTVLAGHSDLVYRLAYSPDGRTLASGGFDRVPRLWDVGTGKSIPLVGHTGVIWDIDFSGEGSVVATAGGEGEIRVWDSRSGALLAKRVQEKVSRRLDLSPDGESVAYGDPNGVTLWQWRSDHISHWGRPGEEATSVRLSRDGRWLAWITNFSQVNVVNLTSGEKRSVPYIGTLQFMEFSPLGTQVAWGAKDGLVVVWDLRTWAFQPLQGHTALITGLAFSADGKWLASASWDRTVRLWSLANGVLRWVHTHAAEVFHVAIAPDGKTVASVGGDRVVKLWRVEPDDHSQTSQIEQFSQWAESVSSARLGDDLQIESR